MFGHFCLQQSCKITWCQRRTPRWLCCTSGGSPSVQWECWRDGGRTATPGWLVQIPASGCSCEIVSFAHCPRWVVPPSARWGLCLCGSQTHERRPFHFRLLTWSLQLRFSPQSCSSCSWNRCSLRTAKLTKVRHYLIELELNNIGGGGITLWYFIFLHFIYSDMEKTLEVSSDDFNRSIWKIINDFLGGVHLHRKKNSWKITF